MTTIRISIPEWLILIFAGIGFIKVCVEIWATLVRRRLAKLKKELEEEE